jgi:glycolate oxidase iron-sulfur subunit
MTTVGAVLQRLRLIPPPLARRLSLPPLPVRQEPLRATGHDVWLFTGCVMDAWQRDIHRASIAVLGACGAGVALPGPGAECCGALHLHAGLREDATRLAQRVMAAFPGSAPVLVDSAGCGAALKDYGHLLGTAEAHTFAARVKDIHEWVAARADRLPPPRSDRRGVTGRPLRIAVQDPCHLRHVQRCESAVRVVLRPYGELVELDDEGRCCGAGGAFSALQPALAGQIRTQKVAVIAAAAPDVVASANPGCGLWLAAAGVPVRHPLEIVASRAGLADTDGR